MTPLLRPVTKMKCSTPASRASSTMYCRIGRSTTVNISLGTALVAGRKRVPRPATGRTALRIGLFMNVHPLRSPGRALDRSGENLLSLNRSGCGSPCGRVRAGHDNAVAQRMTCGTRSQAENQVGLQFDD